MAVDRATLAEGLAQLGVVAGSVVEVHSSLGSFGWVEGGADAVIDALIAAVGPAGTIIMSAYAVSPALPLSEAERARGITWKVRILDPDAPATGLGAVVDAFRRRPDVRLGSGLFRVAAWGPEAGLYAEQGYARLLAHGGRALLLGVDINRCSSMHQGEAEPLPPALAARWTMPDDLRRDYPVDQWSIGYRDEDGPDVWGAVFAEAERRGLVTHARIGDAACASFPAAPVVQILADWRRADPWSLYGVERPAG